MSERKRLPTGVAAHEPEELETGHGPFVDDAGEVTQDERLVQAQAEHDAFTAAHIVRERLELTFKDAAGRPGNQLVYRDDEPLGVLWVTPDMSSLAALAPGPRDPLFCETVALLTKTAIVPGRPSWRSSVAT